MAVYDREAELSHPLDYFLAKNGPVTLYWDPKVLAEAVTWFEEHGYRIARAQPSSWADAADMHTDLAATLEFPDYYGRNLAALNDCLYDVADCRYGLSDDETGLVLVLDGFDAFFERDEETAYRLLDIYADRARGAALFGQRMHCLAQADNPRFTVSPVGATSVSWNPAEWLNSKRGL
jgi:hypothetical protein